MRSQLSMTLFAALALGASVPALAAMTPAQRDATLEKAMIALDAKDLTAGVALLDKVIADSPGVTPSDNTDYVCASGPTDTLIALVGATTSPRKATTVAIDTAVCDALFLKGFTLIDLGRGAEAEPFLRRATELAPDNAHYLNEYAEWYKSARDWDKSYALFARAAELGPQQAEDVRAKRTARALRGMGFNLIEMGKLDEAEAKMKESLVVEPGNEGAKNELAYIKQERAKLGK
jgi:tetratricopeptide (TPR) repeat protein